MTLNRDVILLCRRFANLADQGGITATQRRPYYRLTFPSRSHSHFAISFDADADVRVIDSHTVQGSQRVFGTVAKLANADGETRQYFYAVFSRPLALIKPCGGDELTHDEKAGWRPHRLCFRFHDTRGEQIEVRVGISYISAEQAQHNLERRFQVGHSSR